MREVLRVSPDPNLLRGPPGPRRDRGGGDRSGSPVGQCGPKSRVDGLLLRESGGTSETRPRDGGGGFLGRSGLKWEEVDGRSGGRGDPGRRGRVGWTRLRGRCVSLTQWYVRSTTVTGRPSAASDREKSPTRQETVGVARTGVQDRSRGTQEIRYK